MVACLKGFGFWALALWYFGFGNRKCKPLGVEDVTVLSLGPRDEGSVEIVQEANRQH